jgi:hypothetical protein
MKTGIQLIAAERKRQVTKEGWTAKHDDGHKRFQLTRAAISYAQSGADMLATWDWPWELEDWKPSKEPIRNLVKAGALIAAEIDRLQRNKAR